MLTRDDTIAVTLTTEEFSACIFRAERIARHVVDRHDLHPRDDLERFINVLMGEIAEQMVLSWLIANGKYAKSAVDKTSDIPDIGHDVIVKSREGAEKTCSVKSSLSYKMDIDGILNNFKLATKESELRDINIQVYFWLSLAPPQTQSRVTVPAIRQSAIICWFGSNDISNFAAYNHEKRQAPAVLLKQGRCMRDLLKLLI
jgi:hypothetical protein